MPFAMLKRSFSLSLSLIHLIAPKRTSKTAKNPAKTRLWARDAHRKDCEYEIFSQLKEDLPR
jgi:hypothetical protein